MMKGSQTPSVEVLEVVVLVMPGKLVGENYATNNVSNLLLVSRGE